MKSQESKINTKRGFTLVEMMVAIGLFLVIVSISLGAILSVFDANRRAQATKTAIDNLNLSLENMARTVKFGKNYHCGSSGTLSLPQNCVDNSPAQGSEFLAVTFNGDVVVYRKWGNAIQTALNPGPMSEYTNITAPEMVVQHLKFYVYNTTSFGAGANLDQPYVIAVIKGYVGNKPTNQSSFSIQTTMSQRSLDL